MVKPEDSNITTDLDVLLEKALKGDIDIVYSQKLIKQHIYSEGCSGIK